MTTTQLQSIPGLETGPLKKFAQSARRQLIELVGTKIDQVLSMESAELREKDAAIKELKAQISLSTKEAVVERVAYTWFNRFCALRFMDVSGYTTVRTVSPAEGFTQPEILSEAKQGHIDESIQGQTVRQRVIDLLSGKIPSSDPQQEAYRLLVVGMCNYFHSIMPFMFETIADYTELLMPDDLLSDGSLLAQVRNALTVEACKDVEVIGWLYQFYISEKKDEVFEDLKKSKKISAQNVPAATQLFTPNWIVRFLVQNSLGRLWMLNKPKSRLVDQMEFYIRPLEDETDFLRITKPEELKICDPACGSGHMLVYAFDLLYLIYEEEGYQSTDIPRLILQNNLYGLEIDERAAELAAFALVMKAREKYRRFFTKPIQPNICVFQDIKFGDKELPSYLEFVGNNLFTDNLRKTLHQFAECENFGSLIKPATTDVATIQDLLKKSNAGENLLLHVTHEKVLRILTYADYLSPKYHVVVANPPYMASKNMNASLKAFVSHHYQANKRDLFAAFVERISDLNLRSGFVGLMTPFTWMFLDSYEELRKQILTRSTITTLVRPEYHAFFESAYVPICAFVLFSRSLRKHKGLFVDLSEFYGADVQPVKALAAIKDEKCSWRHLASTEDFEKVPGRPIAYWMSDRALSVFSDSIPLEQIGQPRQGCATSDNGRFLRFWFEVSTENISFDSSSLEAASESSKRWFPYNKGGSFRKWYGNQEYLVNWYNDGQELKQEVARKYPYLNGNVDYVVKNRNCYFRESLSWSKITSGGFALRYFPPGFIFDVSGCSIFFDDPDYQMPVLGCMNSPIMTKIYNALSPTLNFEVGQVANFPIINDFIAKTTTSTKYIQDLISCAKEDWDSYETSWNFNLHPLLSPERRRLENLEMAYSDLRSEWLKRTERMQRLEQQSYDVFIDAYGLRGELTPDAPLSEITLNCNPYYRYGAEKSPEELEELLLLDTIKELISYGVGCIFGRYSLDHPGLFIASPGDSDKASVNGAQMTFPIDDDNVVPILDGDWFTDDISERFRKFIRVCFGDDLYEQNVRFIEKVLGKDLRKYFVKDFYADHVKRYKKRPIYWLFSSPKGAFNALIYLHRYRSDTVSVILNNYLRELRNKLAAHKSHLENISIGSTASAGDKAKAVKEIETLKKTIDELDNYERDVLYPLAMQKMELILDHGVKANYTKLGRALRTIPGMNAEED